MLDPLPLDLLGDGADSLEYALDQLVFECVVPDLGVIVDSEDIGENLVRVLDGHLLLNVPFFGFWLCALLRGLLVLFLFVDFLVGHSRQDLKEQLDAVLVLDEQSEEVGQLGKRGQLLDPGEPPGRQLFVLPEGERFEDHFDDLLDAVGLLEGLEDVHRRHVAHDRLLRLLFPLLELLEQRQGTQVSWEEMILRGLLHQHLHVKVDVQNVVGRALLLSKVPDILDHRLAFQRFLGQVRGDRNLSREQIFDHLLDGDEGGNIVDGGGSVGAQWVPSREPVRLQNRGEDVAAVGALLRRLSQLLLLHHLQIPVLGLPENEVGRDFGRKVLSLCFHGLHVVEVNFDIGGGSALQGEKDPFASVVKEGNPASSVLKDMQLAEVGLSGVLWGAEMHGELILVVEKEIVL